MNAKRRFKDSSSTGTANGQAVGYNVDGTALRIGADKASSPIPGTLAAYVEADCTGGVTWTPVWRVSDDNTTFYDIAPAGNLANVAISTTTTGKMIAAPSEVHGFRYARLRLTTGGVTGVTANVCEISYCFIGS